MTQAPRLDQIDPAAVGAEVTRLVLEHLQTAAFHVGAEVHVTGPSSVGYSAALLADWAKRGTNGEEWDAGMAWDAVQHVCEVLYSQAGVPGTFDGGAIQSSIDAEPSDPIDVVLLAAWARVLIAQRQPVPVRALAALGSCSEKRLRNLGSAGEIEIARGDVKPAEAKRWLGARGVAL